MIQFLVVVGLSIVAGLLGAGVSTFYDEKLVAGYAAGSTVFFANWAVGFLIDQANSEET